MRRITIKSDGFGNVIVLGGEDPGSDYYRYSLSKVMEGKFLEISWEPIEPLIRSKEDNYERMQ